MAARLHFWWFGVFLMGFCAAVWEHKERTGAVMPGGLWGRSGGLCTANPPQCLEVTRHQPSGAAVPGLSRGRCQ